MSAPKLLLHLLNDIWIDIKAILSIKLGPSRQINIVDIKNLKLLVGGGAKQTNDVIRNAFALLINEDESICEILNFLDVEYQHLANQLLNNTKIINSITFLQSDKE
ncbi:unnamed protein product, partial [Rotaria sp. Silwood2]